MRIEKIRDTEADALSISEEDGYPMLLFTPDMSYTMEHHHIELDREQAKLLHDWLGDYLKENTW